MPGGCHPLLDKQLGDALRHTPDRDCPDLESLCVAPHRVESFKLPKDPSFIEKVGNIVALYLYPPDRAPPLSAGEKSQIQALDRTAPLRPMGPGRAGPSDTPMTTSPWDHVLVRSAGRRNRTGHREAPSPPSESGVPALPGHHQPHRPRTPRRPSDSRQLRNAHNAAIAPPPRRAPRFHVHFTLTTPRGSTS